MAIGRGRGHVWAVFSHPVHGPGGADGRWETTTAILRPDRCCRAVALQKPWPLAADQRGAGLRRWNPGLLKIRITDRSVPEVVSYGSGPHARLNVGCTRQRQRKRAEMPSCWSCVSGGGRVVPLFLLSPGPPDIESLAALESDRALLRRSRDLPSTVRAIARGEHL